MFKKFIGLSIVFMLGILSTGIYADEYRGTIGTHPVHLSTFDNDSAYAVYLYDAHGIPIQLTRGGVQSEKQNVLYEGLSWSKPKQKAGAKLTFSQKFGQSDELSGTWENLKTHEQLPIRLSRYNDSAGSLQSASFKNAYIRKHCTDQSEEKMVNLYQKKTNQLLQTITTEGVCRGDEVEVGDFNFDGYEDFSVFAEGFAGANTRSNYYLFNPKTQQYEYSEELTDVTLSFDAKRKVVTSTNQCCAGSQLLVLESKWVNRHLKPITKKCYRWSDEKDGLVRAADHACD